MENVFALTSAEKAGEGVRHSLGERGLQLTLYTPIYTSRGSKRERGRERHSHGTATISHNPAMRTFFLSSLCASVSALLYIPLPSAFK